MATEDLIPGTTCTTSMMEQTLCSMPQAPELFRICPQVIDLLIVQHEMKLHTVVTQNETSYLQYLQRQVFIMLYKKVIFDY